MRVPENQASPQLVAEDPPASLRADKEQLRRVQQTFTRSILSAESSIRFALGFLLGVSGPDPLRINQADETSDHLMSQTPFWDVQRRLTTA
jgi:hypothetical protein